jgi:acyl-CoA thioester hydrolase
MSSFSITLSPRISETDLVGHINNVAITAWFEDLRVRYMRSMTCPGREGGIGSFTLASLTIDFVGETHYGADVVLTMHNVSLGNSSITLEGELHQGDKLSARGKAVMVYWDTQTRRPQRIPDSYREKLDSSQTVDVNTSPG